MKIASSSDTTITGITPKVIETANGFLLNTQYYTKEKLLPVPFEVCSLYGSPYFLNTRKQLCLQQHSWSYPNDEAGILRDTTYPNRYYIRVMSGYISGSRQLRLCTLEETETGIKNIKSFIDLGDCQLIDFVYQDEYFIIYTLRTTSGGFHLHRMDKETFATKSLWSTSSSYSYSTLTKIAENENFVFFNYYANQNMYMLSFDKTSHGVATSQAIYRGENDTQANIYVSPLSDTPYKIDDNTYGLFLYNAGNPSQPIDIYQLDISKPFAEGYTMQKVTITWSNGITELQYYGSNSCGTVRSFISEFDGIKYLNIVTYGSNFPGDFISYQGIYTFRIDSATKLTFISYNQIDSAKPIGGFIYDDSKEHLIVSKQNAFQILKFNKTTKKYECTNFEIPNCFSVGLDEAQRIWYIKADSSVHMINLEDAQSIEIEFEKEYYNYTGTTINTYINFSALNYLGETFTGIFELSISGPAVFTENNSSVLKFTYDSSDKQQIDITITGATPITIYPKFIS